VTLTRDQIQGVFRSFPEAKHDKGRKFNDEPPPVAGPEDFGFDSQTNDDERSGAGAESSVAPSIQWLDMSNWDNEPRPEREWAILNRVPLKQVGLFSGEGGAGKSIIEMMKDVAHVMGKDWLCSLPVPGPAIYLGAEDNEKEIHIRFYDIAAHYGVTFRELIDGGLHVLCLLGQDATLCAAAKSGRVETTGLYRQIYQAAGDLKPKNISIDTLSRAFAGNEIDRVQVYAFAMHMQALAMVAGGSVTVLSHPSLQGIASGSGISGSTAWHGAFRFRQYLKGAKTTDGEQADNDLRALEFKKNQYGPTGETIRLRYERGLFLPEKGASNLDKLAHEQKADETFLALLARYEREGRNVSDKTTAPNSAPAEFAQEVDAKKSKLRKPDLEAAMRRLFVSGKIRVETYGRPSRPYTKLVTAGGVHSQID
jgi:RecA-family ATPase